MYQFLKMPASIIFDNRLAWSDRIVISYLCTYAQHEEEQITLPMSYNDICKELNNELKRNAVILSIKKLQELNLIEAIKQPHGKNRYKVLIKIPKSDKGQQEQRADKPIIQKKNNSAKDPDLDIEKYKVLINKF